MIAIEKGTSAVFIIVPEYTDAPYSYSSGDEVHFAVKEDPEGEAVIEKTLEYDDMSEGFILSLTPEDTAGLTAYPDARYWCDMGLKTGNNYYMIVPCQEFRVERAISNLG